MNKSQRRKHYVDRKVQGALVCRLLGHWLLFVVAAFTLLCGWQVLVSGDPVAGFSVVVAEVAMRNLPVFIALAVLLPVFINDTIKLSHQFAGPIVRLRDALGDVAEGKNVEPLVVRQKDFWHDLIENFNRVLKRTNGKHELS